MTNDPLPWQLTVGALKAALNDVPDGVVVALKLPPGYSGPAELETLQDLRPTYSGGPVFTLSLGPPPGPDYEAMAEAAASHLESSETTPLSRPSIAVRLYQRLHGERRYWQCFQDGLITSAELRDVLISDAMYAVAGQCPSWDEPTPATRTALVEGFDRLLRSDTGDT